jgi:DNA-binding CsgD family transcriptional regulator
VVQQECFHGALSGHVPKCAQLLIAAKRSDARAACEKLASATSCRGRGKRNVRIDRLSRWLRSAGEAALDGNAAATLNDGMAGMNAVERRAVRWLDMVGDWLARPTTCLPRHEVAQELAATFGTQVSWNWMDPNGDLGFDLHTPIPGWPTPEVVSRMTGGVGDHPLIRWFAASGQPAPMSIGRVPQALITPLGREIVNDILVPVGMDQQLSIPYRLAPFQHRAFILGRHGDDFSDEDLQLAGRIQTLLLLLDRQCAVLQRCSAQTAIPLTGRERAVLALLDDGLTSSAIGRRLAISPRTVHRHLQNIYRKLGVSDRLRAVLVARECGLLRSPEELGEPEVNGSVTVRVFVVPVAYYDFHDGGLVPAAPASTKDPSGESGPLRRPPGSPSHPASPSVGKSSTGVRLRTGGAYEQGVRLRSPRAVVSPESARAIGSPD